MIPKKIHYVWVGHNPKSPIIEECIATWKKKLPDYQIIEWNEDNFDMHENRYIEQAYAAKKWAFVSDYVRARAIYEQGGIYLDTDVRVVDKLDSLLNDSAFI
ncbi:glycosyl transferase, partial [Lactobacillus crispatus]